MFIDKVKIHAKAGDGGNGCVSFRREKYVEHGGPDGGEGGKGGSIVLVTDPNVHDRTDFYYAPRLAAPRGDHGRGKNCTGRCGKDIIVKVPIGTQVYRLGPVVREGKQTRYHPAAATEEFEANTPVGRPRAIKRDGARSPSALVTVPEPEAARSEIALHPDDERVLIADLVGNGERFVLAQGGKGGRGNITFKSSILRAPRDFEYGEPGEALKAELELKTLADVGLVGFPNAGKSTLISKLTHAHPKIAAYPFTTKTPKVGVITYEDYQRIRVADIPGLIAGAHMGKGLGHEFLRHIERCRLLIILLDMAGTDNRDPREDYRQLLAELELYNPAILAKPQLVVANKLDVPAAVTNLTKFRRGRKLALHKISALTGEGLEKLKLAIRAALS